MQSGAYRTILTHFSTRYPTMPLFDMDTHPNLSVAMDFMSINIKDLPWLPGMVRGRRVAVSMLGRCHACRGKGSIACSHRSTLEIPNVVSAAARAQKGQSSNCSGKVLSLPSLCEAGSLSTSDRHRLSEANLRQHMLTSRMLHAGSPPGCAVQA